MNDAIPVYTRCTVWQQSGRPGSRDSYWDLVLQCMRHTVMPGSHRQKLCPSLEDEIARAHWAKTSWFFRSVCSGETAQGSISSTHTKLWWQLAKKALAFHLWMWSHSLATSVFTKVTAFAFLISIQFSLNRLILSFHNWRSAELTASLGVSEARQWSQYSSLDLYPGQMDSWLSPPLQMRKKLCNGRMFHTRDKQILVLLAFKTPWLYPSISHPTYSVLQTSISLKENVSVWRVCQTAVNFSPLPGTVPRGSCMRIHGRSWEERNYRLDKESGGTNT